MAGLCYQGSYAKGIKFCSFVLLRFFIVLLCALQPVFAYYPAVGMHVRVM